MGAKGWYRFAVVVFSVVLLSAGVSAQSADDVVLDPSASTVLQVPGNALISGELDLNGNPLVGVGSTQCSAGEALLGDGSCGSVGTPAGSDGQLQFNDAGSFAGTSGLVWDSSNDKLDLTTNSDAVLSFDNTDNSWQYVEFAHSGTRQAWLGLNDQDDFQLHKEDGGDIVLTGTNVGIGTTGPDRGLLHLGDASGTPLYADLDAGSGNGQGNVWLKAFKMGDGSGKLELAGFYNAEMEVETRASGSSPRPARLRLTYGANGVDENWDIQTQYGAPYPNSPLRFIYNGNEIMRLDGRLRVGIGDSSPSNRLDINVGSSTSHGISFDGKTALSARDGNNWLRMNQDNQFSNGVYTPGYFRADGGAEFRGSLNMRNNRVRNLASPSAGDDAATKSYVDNNAGNAQWQKIATFAPDSGNVVRTTVDVPSFCTGGDSSKGCVLLLMRNDDLQSSGLPTPAYGEYLQFVGSSIAMDNKFVVHNVIWQSGSTVDAGVDLGINGDDQSTSILWTGGSSDNWCALRDDYTDTETGSSLWTLEINLGSTTDSCHLYVRRN